MTHATRADDWLGSRAPILVGMAASLALGLFFVFVWAPHPWGWHGIDQYHDLALALARGEPFATTDVPWGYAYFLSIFYRLFGDRPWTALVAQVIVNACVPLLAYHLVRDLFDRRTAGMTALIVGVFSFNTVYASTQSSDGVCTALFLAAVLCAVRAHRLDNPVLLAAAAILFGLSAQFRPNLILFPAVWAGWWVLRSPRSRRRWLDAALLIVVSSAIDVPWIARNYRVTGQFIPTSTHGGVQLWYGALQSGRYLSSRARNPASSFETPAFDYTSLAGVPIRVWAELRDCQVPPPERVDLVYWTDRDTAQKTVRSRRAGRRVEFDIPGQPLETTIYYYLHAFRGTTSQTTPTDGARDPIVFFVSDRHTADLDRHDDLLDAFDLVRLLRHAAWRDPVGTAPLDLDGNGRIDEGDIRAAVAALLDEPHPIDRVQGIETTNDRVTLRLTDRSTFEVPRAWSGRITDVVVEGSLARKLTYAHRSFAGLHPRALPYDLICLQPEEMGVNDLYSRREPHAMRRYTALALDYIGRHPLDFSLASLFRMARVFVVVPTDDPWATYQFRGSGIIYAAAMVVSVAYAGLFVAGLLITVRRREVPWQLMLPILYIPATLCYVLTNMRYTVTVQPFVFVFVAVAVLRFGVPPSRQR